MAIWHHRLSCDQREQRGIFVVAAVRGRSDLSMVYNYFVMQARATLSVIKLLKLQTIFQFSVIGRRRFSLKTIVSLKKRSFESEWAIFEIPALIFN